QIFLKILFIAQVETKVMKNKYFLTAGFLLTILFNAAGQTAKVPLSLDAWDTLGVNPNRETYKGKECFLLKSGAIILKNAELRDGTIEADISFPQQRNFPGIAVRMQGLKNSELFYVRPHQSGNPDATQYTPVFNGSAAWQLYYGEGYGGAFPFK